MVNRERPWVGLWTQRGSSIRIEALVPNRWLVWRLSRRCWRCMNRSQRTPISPPPLVPVEVDCLIDWVVFLLLLALSSRDSWVDRLVRNYDGYTIVTVTAWDYHSVCLNLLCCKLVGWFARVSKYHVMKQLSECCEPWTAGLILLVLDHSIVYISALTARQPKSSLISCVASRELTSLVLIQLVVPLKNRRAASAQTMYRPS